MKLIKFLGSLSFALFLLGLLTVILIVSTSLEGAYGTPTAQRFFYQAGWFDVFLGLVAVNIACSTASRWPFERRHTGFLATHAGILVLLAGCLISRLTSVEGQIMLFEGEKSAVLRQNEYELIAHKHGSQTVQTNLRKKIGATVVRMDAIENGLTLSIDEVSENSRKVSTFEEGSTADPANAAIEISLQSGLAGFKDSVRLVEKDPSDPLSAVKEMGPAHLYLKRKSANLNPEKASFYIRPGADAEEFRIDLDGAGSGEIPVGGGFIIQNLHYYPDARVSEENKLVSLSDKPLNPAVEFDLLGPDKKSKHMVFFAHFPDFESMHSRASDSARPQMRLEWPDSEEFLSTPFLTFYYDGSAWTYSSRSSKSSAGGTLETGKTYETGWMDFRFEVKKLLSRAVIRHRVERIGEGTGNLAAHVTMRKDGKIIWSDWLIEEDVTSLEAPHQDTVLLLRRKSVEVPFELTLKDFRKVDYPGTGNAMAFESDVVLEDPKENLTVQRTISMNKPLDYKGYRIFQSSFLQSPSSGEASVFTVAKNPGIVIIYSGCIIMFIGIILVFFVKPLSSFNRP